MASLLVYLAILVCRLEARATADRLANALAVGDPDVPDPGTELEALSEEFSASDELDVPDAPDAPVAPDVPDEPDEP